MGFFSQKNQIFSFRNYKWQIKAHYFLMYGALAGVSPFLPLIGKSIGLDTTAVGITYTILPICTFIFKPLLGFVADYIQNTKVIVVWLLTTKVILSLFMLFLKPIKETNQNVYHTHQFWIFMLLNVLCTSCVAISFFLTDVSCCEMLGNRKAYFGQQRLYGTAGFGIFTLFSGYLNELMSNEYGPEKYLAGFYVMIALYFLNMLVLIKMDMPKANMSTSIISDVKNLCKSMEFVTFCILIFVIGNLTSLQAHYLFWYITDLGGQQTLLGLITAVQCLISEIPFFFFSGWFIKRLGYFNCLACSLVGFTVRFALYYQLKNPWLVLPIETLHGLTFAVFHASNTAFASAYAPPGTEATVLGLQCGIYQGLGFACGSLLGGFSFKEFGGNETFLIASYLSALSVPATLMAHFVFKRKIYGKSHSIL